MRKDRPMYERADDLEYAIIVFTQEGVMTVADAQRTMEALRDKAREPRDPRKKRKR